MLVLSNLDLGKNQIINIVMYVLAQAPSNPSEGQIYYNSVDKKMHIYNGSIWIALDPTNAAEHVNNGSVKINMDKIEGLSAALNEKETSQGAQNKANNALESAKNYVNQEINKLIDGAPDSLNTLKEISDALSKNKNLDGVINEAIAKKTGKFFSFIGDNSAKEFNVQHNLKTKDVIVQISEKNAPYSVVYTDVDIINENSINVKFATAPGEQQYKVVVIG